jgi:hypothetical protein
MAEINGGWEAAHEIYEQLRDSCMGAGAQVSMSFQASSFDDVIAGGSNDIGHGTGLGTGL